MQSKCMSEKCVSAQLMSYLYMSGVIIFYTMFYLSLPVTIGILVCMAKMKQRKQQLARKQQAPRKKEDDPNTFLGLSILTNILNVF